MKKDLPQVFANAIDKEMHNVQEYYYGNDTRNEVKLNYDEVIKKVEEIFHSPNYVYKINCDIVVNGKNLEKVVVGKTKNGLITMDNEIINFKDIEDINIK